MAHTFANIDFSTAGLTPGSAENWTVATTALAAQIAAFGDGSGGADPAIFFESFESYEFGWATWNKKIGTAFADDGGVFTDETADARNEATADDVTLIPAAPAVGDAYYYGDARIFSRIRFDVSTAGAGTYTIVFEYYNGSAYVAIPSIIDPTSDFTASGVLDVVFTPPSDWVIDTVNTVEQFWIRSRVSAFTSITTQPLAASLKIGEKFHNRPVVTSSEPYALEDNDQLVFNIDGTVQSINLETSDFSDITAATSAELHVALGAKLSGVNVELLIGRVRVSSSTADVGTIEFWGGSAGVKLGFSPQPSFFIDGGDTEPGVFAVSGTFESYETGWNNDPYFTDIETAGIVEGLFNTTLDMGESYEREWGAFDGTDSNFLQKVLPSAGFATPAGNGNLEFSTIHTGVTPYDTSPGLFNIANDQFESYETEWGNTAAEYRWAFTQEAVAVLTAVEDRVYTITVAGTAFTHTGLAAETTTTIATALAALVDVDSRFTSTSAVEVIDITPVDTRTELALAVSASDDLRIQTEDEAGAVIDPALFNGGADEFETYAGAASQQVVYWDPHSAAGEYILEVDGDKFIYDSPGGESSTDLTNAIKAVVDTSAAPISVEVTAGQPPGFGLTINSTACPRRVLTVTGRGPTGTAAFTATLNDVETVWTDQLELCSI